MDLSVILEVIFTGLMYVLPVIIFRKLTKKRIEKYWIAFAAVSMYSVLLHVAYQTIVLGEVISNVPPWLWIIVGTYFISAETPIFFKDKPEGTANKVEEDGTIVIEQPVEPQKYKMKKKLKILVGILSAVLLISISINFYFVYTNYISYDKDELVLYSEYTGYYHAFSCEDAQNIYTRTSVRDAEKQGYQPCSKCKPPQ